MSAFAWPLSLCIAGLVALLIFKKEISRFIDRTKTISREGVITETNALASQGVRQTSQPSQADKLLKEFDNTLLLEQENFITDVLQAGNVQDASTREKVLVRYLAGAYIINRFEGAYHSIFGSQLRALEMLNQSEPQGVPNTAVEAWYEVGKAGYPLWYAAYSFEDWFNYLQAMTLILVAPNGLVHITVFGREFLKYLVDRGYSTTKNG